MSTVHGRGRPSQLLLSSCKMMEIVYVTGPSCSHFTIRIDGIHRLTHCIEAVLLSGSTEDGFGENYIIRASLKRKVRRVASLAESSVVSRHSSTVRRPITAFVVFLSQHNVAEAAPLVIRSYSLPDCDCFVYYPRPRRLHASRDK